jgi:hypothetical protein
MVFGLFVSHSQNKQLLYNWEATQQSLMLNPGSIVSYDSHIGIPFLSQAHTNLGSSELTVSDVFADDGVPINTKIEQMILNLSSRDFFTATQQLEILSIGYKTRYGTYISFGMYQELDVIVYFPKDLAILAREGNRDYIGYPFNFDNISFRGDLLTVFHLGFNEKISNKLTAGIRFKLYSSMLNITSTRNTGTLTTTRTNDTPNIYQHTISDLDVAIKTSGYTGIREIDDDKKAFRNLVGRAYFGGNLGLGIDLGGTYEFSKDFRATASLLDLGAIFHSQRTEITSARGDYTFDGVELVFPDVESGDVTIPAFDNFEEEFKKAIPIDTSSGSYSQWRPAKFNAGLHYNFGLRLGSKDECDCLVTTKNNRRRSQIGAQYYTIFRPKGPQMAGTVYYNRNFNKDFSVKTTYTVDSFSATNIGLGFAANIGEVNFFLALDNLLDLANLANANSVSLQLGFNYIVGKE